jgi:hypothetical protein
MSYKTWAIVLFTAYALLSFSGCSCKCETVCTRENRVYNYTSVDMRRSECNDLQNHLEEVRAEARKDSTFEFVLDTNCSYSCID